MKDVNADADAQGATWAAHDMKTEPEKYREQREVESTNPKSNFDTGVKMAMQRRHEQELREMH